MDDELWYNPIAQKLRFHLASKLLRTEQFSQEKCSEWYHFP